MRIHSNTTSKGNKLQLILLLLVCTLASFSVSAQSKYVKKYRPIVDSLSTAYGVPVAVIFGVSIIESGSGTSRNCKLLKNHFGIIGKNNLLKTKGIKTRYKQYPDDKSSFVDFCRLMKKKKFYTRLKGNQDYKLWVDAISKAGYSTVPEEWKKLVSSCIRKNKLYDL